MQNDLYASLNHAGLNMQAVFALSDLPDDIVGAMTAGVSDAHRFNQLLLLGHAGAGMWQQLQGSGFRGSEHPVDDYVVAALTQWLADTLPDACYAILYPFRESMVPLQRLGELAGWHHASPFRIGVNQQYGSWFAYRAVVLLEAKLPLTVKMEDPSPCDGCKSIPCVDACPADALGHEYSLTRCIDYRLQSGSPCQDRCLARLACPVASAYRYPLDQIRYAYGCSFETIQSMQESG